MKALSLIILVLILNGCGSEYVAPLYSYEAKFDPQLVDDVELYIKNVGNKEGYRIFEKDRHQMKFLSKGKEAFFIAYYYNGNPILAISTAGMPELLNLMLLDYGDLPITELERLAKDIRNGLKEKFNLDLKEKKFKT